jgi:hypothetical protein
VHLQAYATFLRTVRGEDELAAKVLAAAESGQHAGVLDAASSRSRRRHGSGRRRRHRD